MDFSKFDSMIDIDGLKKDIEEAQNNTKIYEDLPNGVYEVKVTKMELGESKKGTPMVTIRFDVIAGDYTKRVIFYNQVITQGFQLHLCNLFLRSLGTNLDVNFENFQQYSELLADVFKRINDDGLEYSLELGKKGDYPTYKIVDVFESSSF